MTFASLAVKALLALILLLAGAAKLADRDGFASTLRLFLTPRAPSSLARAVAVASAGVEVAVGAASLTFARAWPLDVVVLALGCVFVAASALGYAFHRGASCNCFGHLSHRTFGVVGIMRSLAIVGLAAFVVAWPPGATNWAAGPIEVLLLAAGSVVAWATFTAATNLALASAPPATQGRR